MQWLPEKRKSREKANHAPAALPASAWPPSCETVEWGYHTLRVLPEASSRDIAHLLKKLLSNSFCVSFPAAKIHERLGSSCKTFLAGFKIAALKRRRKIKRRKNLRKKAWLMGTWLAVTEHCEKHPIVQTKHICDVSQERDKTALHVSPLRETYLTGRDPHKRPPAEPLPQQMLGPK